MGGRGGIGRHVRLRGVCREACWFKSSRPHHSSDKNESSPKRELFLFVLSEKRSVLETQSKGQSVPAWFTARGVCAAQLAVLRH